MNSNLNRAFAAAVAVFGGVAPALAQIDTDIYCIDPANSKPYSDVFIYQPKRNNLFGATIGITGTVAYGPNRCDGGGPIAGRIGFTIGHGGSIQDSLDELKDDDLRLTRGTNFGDTGGGPGFSYRGPFITPTTGSNSFARVYVSRTTLGTGGTAGTTTTNSYLYGGNGIRVAFAGLGGRYSYTDAIVNGTAANGVTARLIMDVLGDAARLNWRLTNTLQTTDTVSLGLTFAQIVELNEGRTGPQYVHYGPPGTLEGFSTVYMTIPGRKPLIADERFSRTNAALQGVPPYINFSMNQRSGFGLQVVNDPSALTVFDAKSGIDQTPVDEFVLGKPTFLIPDSYSATDPTIIDILFNGELTGDNVTAALAGDPAYVQKWFPSPVATGEGRNIVAYYRSTSFDSSYAPLNQGYSATVDTPKAVSTNPATINTSTPFRDLNGAAPGDFTLRVNVDNTGGFTNPDLQVVMSSVTVTLRLPAGMSRPSDGAQTITQTITGGVGALQIGTADFPVKVDPNLFGAQTYTVTITPQPGYQAKTITGTINVAAVPRLRIVNGPNLVSPPWQFADASWDAILNKRLNEDYQAYTWDAAQQQYVPQISAERGIGTWIVAQSDLNFLALGGSPTQPDDEFPNPADYLRHSGNGIGPTVALRQGWNLVGNPYNYAFPLGQLIGVPQNGSGTALSFSQLIANKSYTDGSFAYYDQGSGEYRTIPGRASSRLQPNYGYWIYANQAFELQFPPLYELFIRSAEPAESKQRFDNWKLQLGVVSPSSNDTQNFVGIARTAQDASAMSYRKAPMPPKTSKTGVLYSFVTGDAGIPMAQSLRSSTGAQTFKYNVYTQKTVPVTVTWPNLDQIPSNLAVTVTDPISKKTVNARKASGYTFTSSAQTFRTLTVTVTPSAAVRQRILDANYSTVRTAGSQQGRIDFKVAGRGAATISVYRGNTFIGDVESDLDIVPGANRVLWSMLDKNGQPVENGSYTLKVTAIGEGGDKATYQTPITVRR